MPAHAAVWVANQVTPQQWGNKLGSAYSNPHALCWLMLAHAAINKAYSNKLQCWSDLCFIPGSLFLNAKG